MKDQPRYKVIKDIPAPAPWYKFPPIPVGRLVYIKVLEWVGKNIIVVSPAEAIDASQTETAYIAETDIEKYLERYD